MNVLHLPVNIASQTSVTVRALREIGVDARGVIRNNTPYQDARGIETFTVGSTDTSPVRSRLQRLPWWWAVARALRWADVVHWHSRSRALPATLDLKYLALVNKPRVVEFWGTDIRDPAMASADNPYMAGAFETEKDNARRWARMARKTQEKFSRYGFECIIPSVEMEPYIDRRLFPRMHATMQRVMLSDFEPRFPDALNRRPVVVHSPSHKGRKGTDAVMDAVNALKGRCDFEFRLVTGVKRCEALEIVRNCDVVIAELVSGAYGLAALEAMAMGKPVICYLKPSLVSKFPADCAIVNANPGNLADVLGRLLSDGALRNRVGRDSRAYVEKHHDALALAKDLLKIYEGLGLGAHRGGHRRR